MRPDKLDVVGRRNFLSGLASIGLSTAAVQNMSKDRLSEITGDPTDRVPRLSVMEHCNEGCVQRGEPPEREPVYYTIPHDEFAYREAHYEVARDLAAELEREREGEFTGWVTTRTNGHQSEKVVRIERDVDDDADAIPLEDLQGEVPARTEATVGEGDQATVVDDIPVIVEEAPEGDLSDDSCTANYYHDRYEVLAGGAATSGCTLGPPAYDHDAEAWRLTSAGHCFSDGSGQWVSQPCDDTTDNLVGKVDKHVWRDGDGDAATIDLSLTDRDLHNSIVTEDTWNNAPIYGSVAVDQLKDMEGDSSYTVYKQGATTGRRDHHIIGVSADPDGVGTFETYAGGRGGDSGGPYWIEPGNRYAYKYVIGIHYWDGTRTNRTRGTIMADYEEKWNLEA